MIQQVTDKFADRLIVEQMNRDSAFNRQGDFAENSLIEHLYRYWLESVLASLGFSQIRREVGYPGLRSTRGRKRACDLVCFFADKEYWIELKVAYEDTGYTDLELLSDFEKLIPLENANKLYITVFITKTSKPCRKMILIQDKAKEFGVTTVMASREIPTPWKSWKNSHIHVSCHHWQV